MRIATHPSPPPRRRDLPAGRRIVGGALLLASLTSQLVASAAPTIITTLPLPRLTMQVVPGVIHELQYQSNLQGLSWLALATFQATTTVHSLIDTSNPAPPRRFYRVTHAAPPPQPPPGPTRLSIIQRLIIESELGITNQIQFTTDPIQSPWTVLTNLVVAQSPYAVDDLTTATGTRREYRVLRWPPDNPPPSTNMALIPSGGFTMGDALDGMSDALPVHSVNLSAFYMDRTEITGAQWDRVQQWAITNGYQFTAGALRRGTNHPVHSVAWHDAVKWCNARSEMEGRTPAYYTNAAHSFVYRSGALDLSSEWIRWDVGYRLPTEAEWEKAARGGNAGHRFPWADAETIAHARANYTSFWTGGQPFHAYDTSSTSGFHPAFAGGEAPHTSPGGYFAANGYGLHDLAGNVWEWCGDWWATNYYASAPATNPRGPASGNYRVLRGGSWSTQANGCRTAYRGNGTPDSQFNSIGFRCVLPAD